MVLRSKELPTSMDMLPMRTPDHDDWARLRDEIEHLYIRKRHKLRYIMQHVERKYRLKATEQMYKKRFARWSLQKNSKSCPSPTSESGQSERNRREVVRPRIRQCKNIKSIPSLPHLSKQDLLTLTLLGSVKTWSTSYFESWTYSQGSCSPARRYPIAHQADPEVVIDFVYALKLVNDLLSRGHGKLAGRVTRKAFLMLEDSIELDNPALTWNLFEIMYQMISLHHTKLCRLLLAHLSALVDRQMTRSHPFSSMLHAMNELLVIHAIADSETRESSPPSIDTPSASPTDSATSPSITSPSVSSTFVLDEEHPSYVILSLLRQSWAVNAGIIFQNLDMSFFGLYCNIDWDLCWLGLSSSELNAARQWFTRLDTQGEHDTAMNTTQGESYIVDVSERASEQLNLPLTLDENQDFAQVFGGLRANTIARLRRDWDAIIHKSADFSGDNTVIIRILAGLVTANQLRWPAIGSECAAETIASSEIPRMHAGHVASAIRTLLDIERDMSTSENVLDPRNIESIRAIIALCEHAYGETDPRVVRELWSLQDAFDETGDRLNAQQIEEDALQRLERYVCDIPLHGI